MIQKVHGPLDRDIITDQFLLGADEFVFRHQIDGLTRWQHN
jgi:hypothetical protein